VAHMFIVRVYCAQSALLVSDCYQLEFSLHSYNDEALRMFKAWQGQEIWKISPPRPLDTHLIRGIRRIV
jgi:hypothetical protein